MERERITISIKRDLLKKIDQTIDGTAVRNRSHAIENLVSTSLGITQTKNMVILVGGKGALKSIPTVKEILKLANKSGFSDVHIALGTTAESVKDRIGDGADFGLSIHYLEDGEGTAGALLPLRAIFDDTFIVVDPGEFVPDDIQSLIEFHKSHYKMATMLTNDLTNPKGFYVFEPEIFNQIPEGFSMLEDDVFPKLIENFQLVLYPAID